MEARRGASAHAEAPLRSGQTAIGAGAGAPTLPGWGPLAQRARPPAAGQDARNRNDCHDHGGFRGRVREHPPGAPTWTARRARAPDQADGTVPPHGSRRHRQGPGHDPRPGDLPRDEPAGCGTGCAPRARGGDNPSQRIGRRLARATASGEHHAPRSPRPQRRRRGTHRGDPRRSATAREVGRPPRSQRHANPSAPPTNTPTATIPRPVRRADPSPRTSASTVPQRTPVIGVLFKVGIRTGAAEQPSGTNRAYFEI